MHQISLDHTKKGTVMFKSTFASTCVHPSILTVQIISNLYNTLYCLLGFSTFKKGVTRSWETNRWERIKVTKINMIKGEGLMLYNPNAFYTAGRTDSILKVKVWLPLSFLYLYTSSKKEQAYLEEDVTFVKRSPKSYSFVCKQYVFGWTFSDTPIEQMEHRA